MSIRFEMSVPVPTYVGSEEEAWDLLHLLMSRFALEPDEPFGFDTETTGKKIVIKKSGRNPLDWMSDYVILWSLAAKMNGEIYPQWVEYLRKWHPEHFYDGVGDSVEAEDYGRWAIPGEYLHIFTALLEGDGVKLTAWNAKYDAHVCWNTRVDLWNAELWDAMIAGYLFDENLQGRMSLKVRAPEWCNINMVKFGDLFADVVLPDGSKPVEFSTDLRDLIRYGYAEKVSDYASMDAYAVLKVTEYLRENLMSIPMGNYAVHEMWHRGEREGIRSMWDYFLEVEVPMTKVLWRMERRGLGINREALKEIGPKMEAETQEVGHAINRAVGEPINPNSTAQLVNYFFNPENELGLKLAPRKMTKGGRSEPKPSVDKEVLEDLEMDGYEVAKLILRSRKLVKMYGTYIHNLDFLSNYFDDHRIHPSFNQYGARTGRFSTENPNSQNFPRPKGDEFGIRKMFVAPPGSKLIVSDYEQLEMRIMAHFSRDKRMVEAIASGMDLHCYTVSVMYNLPYDEVIAAKKAKDPDERQSWMLDLRQAAKAIGFGLIYGAGAKKIAAQLGITKDEAQDKINDYFRAFPGVLQFIEYTHAQCKEFLFVVTIVGRLRRLKEIRHTQFMLRSAAEREAVNSIIQGSASDITKFAMLLIESDPQLNAMGVKLLNQVHDELVMEVPEKHAADAAPLIVDYMERPFGGQDPLIVPTPVDLKIVDTWAQAK